MKRPNNKFLLVVLILVLGSLLFLWNAFSWWRSQPDDRIDILYSLALQNTTNHPVNAARLDVYGPVSRTASQQCARIETSHPHTLTKDAFGNQTLSFHWDILPPLSTKVITIQSSILRWRTPQPWEALDPKEALAPEAFIESKDPGILAQAKRLKAKTDRQTVKNIFDWVAGHIDYQGYIRKNRGAAYALKYRKGDCTEYAALFVALCRANNIPANMLGGFICPRSAVVNPTDYHNWAEFYQGGRWHPADPQNNKFMGEASHYVALQIIRPSAGLDGYLISRIEGKGLKATFK